MNKPELAQAVYDICHLTGEFKLRSGQVSNEYFDKYRFESQPHLLRPIAEHMKTLIPEDTEILAGLEMGGIPVAVALGFETGLPVLFVRKEAKDYGTRQFAEGLDFKGKKVCVIEDVVTTGGQVVVSTEQLREAGALIDTALCVIQRGENLSKLDGINLDLRPLFQKSDFQ